MIGLVNANQQDCRLSIAALWPWPARAEATNWSVRVGRVYSGGACRTDEDRAGAGAYCPIHSMVREPYHCIIGDAPIGAIPLGRVATVRGSLRRHAYAVKRASVCVKTPVSG